MDRARVTAEWAIVSDETMIVSRETGECWFLDLTERCDLGPFSVPMSGGEHEGAPALSSMVRWNWVLHRTMER